MKSKELLDEFVKYCYENPDLRFWQALRDWCNWNYILVYNGKDDPTFPANYHDTFYWEKNKSPEDFKN